MNDLQVEAFRGANGGGLTVTMVDNLWSGVFATVMVLWTIWVFIQVYKNWTSGRAAWGDSGGQVLRTVFLLVVMLTVVALW